MLDKILETASSHPLYAVLGVATLLYLVFAIIKRVIKIIILAAVLVLAYMFWMYLHPSDKTTGLRDTDRVHACHVAMI